MSLGITNYRHMKAITEIKTAEKCNTFEALRNLPRNQANCILL
jgi:hypothetical protein